MLIQLKEKHPHSNMNSLESIGETGSFVHNWIAGLEYLDVSNDNDRFHAHWLPNTAKHQQILKFLQSSILP